MQTHILLSFTAIRKPSLLLTPSSFWMKLFSVILRNNSYDPVGRRKVVKRTAHSFTGRCERREALKRKDRGTGGGERYQNSVNSPGRYICHHLYVTVCMCFVLNSPSVHEMAEK